MVAERATDAGRVPVGELIRRSRVARGLSQSAVAAQLGWVPSTINRYEAGARAPDRAALIALAEAMDVAPDELDRWLAAAGFLPRSLEALDPADPEVRAVVRALADPDLPPEVRAEVRAALRLIGRLAALASAASRSSAAGS